MYQNILLAYDGSPDGRDFLDAVGYGEIAREFRKLHEIYPTVAPQYAKPSWRL